MFRRLTGWFLGMVFLAVLLPLSPLVQGAAFNSQLSPGTIIGEGNRGESMNFTIRFTNLLEGNTPQLTDVQVQDFFYDAQGRQQLLEEGEELDASQSLRSWIDVDDQFEAFPGKTVELPVKVTIPEDASFGDHNAAVYFTASGSTKNAAIVGVQARLATLFTIKVKGGAAVLDGEVKELDIDVRERARNTATISFAFKNTGTEFFSVQSIVDVFDIADPTESDQPIKTLQRVEDVFPNVRKRISLRVGDLGEDFGEGEYYARIRVREMEEEVVGKEFLSVVKPFQYYLPLLDREEEVVAAPVPSVQTPVFVQPPIIDIVKELGFYVGGFIILLVVLIRILFFPNGVGRGRSSRKRK